MNRVERRLNAYLGILREAFHAWLEWQDAKYWVKEFHPGWLQIARKAKTKNTRRIYREKILKAYRGDSDE